MSSAKRSLFCHGSNVLTSWGSLITHVIEFKKDEPMLRSSMKKPPCFFTASAILYLYTTQCIIPHVMSHHHLVAFMVIWPVWRRNLHDKQTDPRTLSLAHFGDWFAKFQVIPHQLLRTVSACLRLTDPFVHTINTSILAGRNRWCGYTQHTDICQ